MHSSWKVRFLTAVAFMAAMLFVCLGGSVAAGATQEVNDFIAKIQDGNADVRYAAWRSAGNVGAPAVVLLGKLVASENRGVAKAASEALNVIAHYASRPGAEAERKAVTEELMKLLGQDQPHVTRVRALGLLALAAGDECVPPIARLLTDEKLMEEARRTLERIPGKASIGALMEALEKVPEDFRPAIIHSLGHKGAVEALDVLVSCAGSADKKIMLAAYDALSHIGEVPSRWPEGAVPLGELSERERGFIANAFLRFAEKRADKGDSELAMTIYRGVLGRATQEHFKCAGLIGLGKVGSASAVDAIVPWLAEESPAVARSAMEALVALKGPGVDEALQKAAEAATETVKELILKALSPRKAGWSAE